MSALLGVQGVSRTFGATRAVDNVSFTVAPGEIARADRAEWRG